MLSAVLLKSFFPFFFRLFFFSVKLYQIVLQILFKMLIAPLAKHNQKNGDLEGEEKKNKNGMVDMKIGNRMDKFLCIFFYLNLWYMRGNDLCGNDQELYFMRNYFLIWLAIKNFFLLQIIFVIVFKLHVKKN